MNFANDEPMTAVAVAPAAQQDGDGLFAVAGKQEALQVVVLIARKARVTGGAFFKLPRQPVLDQDDVRSRDCPGRSSRGSAPCGAGTSAG